MLTLSPLFDSMPFFLSLFNNNNNIFYNNTYKVLCEPSSARFIAKWEETVLSFPFIGLFVFKLETQM